MAQAMLDKKSEENDYLDEVYPYQLVQFISPAKWITFDKSRGKCICSFLAPPDEKEDLELLHSFIENLCDPPEDWPVYTVNIHGHAKIYTDAQRRLNKLESELYAFSTDTENRPDKKAAAIEKSFRTKKLAKDLDAMTEIMSVPQLSCAEKSSKNVPRSLLSYDSSEILGSDSDIDRGTITIRRKKNAKTTTITRMDKNTTVEPMSQQMRSVDVNNNTGTLPRKERRLKELCSDDYASSNKPKSVILDSSEYQHLTRTLIELTITVKELSADQRKLTFTLEACSILQQGIKASNKPFAEKYDVELPMKSLHDFEASNQKLHEKDCKQDFTASLHFLIDRTNIVSKSTASILKKYMSRELAMIFTAVKKTAGKEVLKGTRFIKILIDVLTSTHTDRTGACVTEQTVISLLGAALTNAKDWDGHRAERVKKDKAKSRNRKMQLEKKLVSCDRPTTDNSNKSSSKEDTSDSESSQ